MIDKFKEYVVANWKDVLGITVVVLFFLLMLLGNSGHEVNSSGNHRIDMFIEWLNSEDYTSAYYKLRFDGRGSQSSDAFAEFAKLHLRNKEYEFDEKTGELVIDNGEMTYTLELIENEDDWYLKADDLFVEYKMRCLSIVYEKTYRDKNWNVGILKEEEYVGDGIVELTLLRYRKPQIEIAYCIDLGGGFDGTNLQTYYPSVYAVFNVDNDGKIIEIENIYNAVTKEELDGGISENASLENNVFTVKKYLFGENYLNEVARIPMKVLFDMAKSVMVNDITFEKYQEEHAYMLSNTESLKNYYEMLKLAAKYSTSGVFLRADTFEILQYEYSRVYYLGSNYDMKIRTSLLTENRYKIGEYVFYASFVPGEHAFILNEIQE